MQGKTINEEKVEAKDKKNSQHLYTCEVIRTF